MSPSRTALFGTPERGRRHLAGPQCGVQGGSFSSFQPTSMTKIVKSVITPLADQNISVSMLSTYQMDFILVHE